MIVGAAPAICGKIILSARPFCIGAPALWLPLAGRARHKSGARRANGRQWDAGPNLLAGREWRCGAHERRVPPAARWPPLHTADATQWPAAELGASGAQFAITCVRAGPGEPA